MLSVLEGRTLLMMMLDEDGSMGAFPGLTRGVPLSEGDLSSTFYLLLPLYGMCTALSHLFDDRVGMRLCCTDILLLILPCNP